MTNEYEIREFRILVLVIKVLKVQVISVRLSIFKEFYEREDHEALSMTMASIEKSFLEHSQVLKQKLVDSCCGSVKVVHV